METKLAQLMTRSLAEVFGQPDATLRKIATAELYTEDCKIVEADDEYVGRRGVNTRAENVLGLVPGFALCPAGPAEVIGDVGFVRWRLGAPGAPPAVTGLDVALLHGGRIRTLYCFVDRESLGTFMDQLSDMTRGSSGFLASAS